MRISKYPVISSNTETEYVVGIQKAKSAILNTYAIVVGIKKRTKFFKREYWELLHESEYMIDNHDFVTAAANIVKEYEEKLDKQKKHEAYINSRIDEFKKWDGRVQ